MNQNMNQKLNEILQSLDPEKRRAAEQSAERLLRTPEGRKLASELKNGNTDSLARLLMGMNTKDVKEKLQQADPKALSGLSLEEILKKLR